MRLRGYSAAPPPISSFHPDWSNWPPLPSALLAPPSLSLVRDVIARRHGNGGRRSWSGFVFSGFHVHRHCLLPSFQTRTAEVVSTSGELSFSDFVKTLSKSLWPWPLLLLQYSSTVRDRAWPCGPLHRPPSQTPYSHGRSGNEGSRLSVSRGSEAGIRPRFLELSRPNEKYLKRASCSLMCSKS